MTQPPNPINLFSIYTPQRKVILANIGSITASRSQVRGGGEGDISAEPWTPNTVQENRKIRDNGNTGLLAAQYL